MDLITFISDPARKAALAEKTGASPAYLWQVATGWTPKGGRPKRASGELAAAIELATSEMGPDVVTRQSLRPDIFGPLPVAQDQAEREVA